MIATRSRYGSGVWGDAGTSGIQSVGVIGTADDSDAGYFANNSPTGWETLVAVAYGSTSVPLNALNNATGGDCYVDANGNLNCTGAKNAVVPVDGGARTVALAAIESPKNWFEDFGSAQLVNGAAVVAGCRIHADREHRPGIPGLPDPLWRLQRALRL